MKKILFVVDERKMGGVSSVLKGVLDNIDKKNNEIDLLILHNNGSELNDINNVNIIYGNNFFSVVDIPLKEIIKQKNIVRFLKKVYLIFLLKTGIIKNKIEKERKKMKLGKYDTEIAFKDGFCTIFTAYGDSNKKLSWIHSDYSNNNPASKYMNTYCDSIKKIDEFICISESVKEKFVNTFNYQKNINVINNYINIKRVKELSREINIKNEKEIEFITVGRLNKVKGYDRLIDVFKKLNDENLLRNVKLTIVGDGEEREGLIKLVKNYSLDKNIEFTLKKDNPYPYIFNKDAFILCSYSEAYPLTVIESMTLKVPVVATEYSSAKEMIINDYNGKIIKNDEKELYKELKRIINNPELLKKYKKNLENYNYDNENIINKINELF